MSRAVLGHSVKRFVVLVDRSTAARSTGNRVGNGLRRDYSVASLCRAMLEIELLGHGQDELPITKRAKNCITGRTILQV